MPKTETGPLYGIVIEANTLITLDELCRVTSIQRRQVIELVEQQLIAPQGPEHNPDAWQFDSSGLKRVRCAANLLRDLELNWPGVLLALKLLEDIDELETQLNILRRN